MSQFKNGPSFFSCILWVILDHLKIAAFKSGGTRCTERGKLSVCCPFLSLNRQIFFLFKDGTCTTQIFDNLNGLLLKDSKSTGEVTSEEPNPQHIDTAEFVVN